MDSDPGDLHYVPQLLLLLFLILINAYFAAAEMAIVSVSKVKIKSLAADGDRRAAILQGLLEQPNKFLSTIQVAITLAGFLTSATAATAMADDVGGVLRAWGVPYGYQVAVVLITLVLSYFNLV
ncbi:MAG: CNNM domain-containing protein, partial [Clostridiales Family XIII bacterium]|nr:CNNM domain-containing protein [Clostridiales Family XIII bacterium]